MPPTIEIHPAIGFCRLGDSDEFHFGPDPFEAPPSNYRDSTHKLKKQAVRFRVFQCSRNADGSLASSTEIVLAPGLKIEWSVALANRKASAKTLEPGLPPFRNPNTSDRSLLVIQPTAQQISGATQAPLDFDNCVFLGKRLRNSAGTNVSIGAIRTDDQGRLIVTGGRGDAGSSMETPLKHFADNDDWWDDTADGSVSATVTLADGSVHIPDPAWVIVGPPDFAPPIENIVTLYDIAYQATFGNVPTHPSFRDDVMPILERFVGLQWVNNNFRLLFGPGSPNDFASKWDQFGDPAQMQTERAAFFAQLRDPSGAPQPQDPTLPPLNDETDTDKIQMLTETQYKILRFWANGTFQKGPGTPVPASPPTPDTLTRAILDATAGAAFFPGIESNRIMRDPAHYSGPFRIQADPAKPGHLLPGQLTMDNAIPWQADFSACRQQGSLGWWPAQRPDDVRTDPNSPATVAWNRHAEGAGGMVQKWQSLGIVQAAKDTAGNTVFIELERTLLL